MQTFAAPVGTWVRVTTALVLAVAALVAIKAVVILLDPSGAHAVAVVMLVLSILVPGVAWLYSPRGYRVDATAIEILRPVGRIRIALAGARVYRDDKATSGALRVFGNGGLFSISGRFYSRQRGWMRWYLRNRRQLVMVESGGRKWLLSPDDADRFVAATATH